MCIKYRNFTSMPRRPAAAAPSESCRFVACPVLRGLPWTSIIASPAGKAPSSAVITCRCAAQTTSCVPQCDHGERTAPSLAIAISVRSLQPMNRLRLMLPCLEAVEGGRGRLGHRSTFSTCQCARSIGASTGVDPQKERRASAANWFWQAMINVARPPPATETTPAWWNGHAKFSRRS